VSRRIWVLVALVVIIVSQLTILSSFFHPIQTQGFGICCSSIIVISKQSYVYGWVSIDIQGPSAGYPATLQFQNGSQISLSSEYKFDMKLPKTGDCFCSAGTDAYGVNLNQSQPIGAVVMSNASSFEISSLPNSTTINNGLFNVYWFVIQGYSQVTITGYGVAV
jgi:hypothetical protein